MVWSGSLPGAARRARSWALALLAFLSCPLTVSAQGEPTELRSIRFEGAKSFSDVLLRAAIYSTQSGCKNIVLEVIRACALGMGRDPRPVDRNALLSDVIRLRYFYREHGYRETRVVLDTVLDGGIMRATFRITEGEPVRVASLEIGGVDQVDSASRIVLQRARSRLPLQVGAVFSDIAFYAARDTLIHRLQNTGYAHAEVFNRYRIPRDSARTAHVGFDLAPASRIYFGEPQIQGNEKVATRVIRRMLAMEGGDVYSRDAILRSQRNLFGLEMFRNIDIRTDLDAAGDTITPVVLVEEGPLTRVRAGLGLSTAESFNGEARWTARNVLGGARRVEVRARLANGFANQFETLPGFEEAAPDKLDYSLSVDLTQPWFFDLKNSLGAGLFVERRSIPTVFVRTSRGAYIGVTRALGPGTSVSAGYRPELSALDAQDEIFCISFVACDASEIRLLREPNRLAPLTASFARDRSNSLFAPTRGYIIRLEGEYAAALTGSEFGYARLAGEWTTYREPLRGLVLASRVRPGWAQSIDEPGAGLGLHPQKRFFAGGASSVRGFAQYRLGPKLLTIDASKSLLTADTVIGWAGCTAQAINAGNCDATLLADSAPGRLNVRPVGGAVAFEGNLEARFPLIGQKLRGALFADVGQVWTANERVRPSDLIWTPGVGLRYFSAIGPIRFDVGYNTQGTQQLQVLTNKVCKPDADDRCTPDSIEDGVIYNPAELRNTGVLTALSRVPWGANRSPWNRLQLHFSIGQAF